MNARLTELLDRQDRGVPLTDAEQLEAEGLVDLAELLALLRLLQPSGQPTRDERHARTACVDVSRLWRGGGANTANCPRRVKRQRSTSITSHHG